MAFSTVKSLAKSVGAYRYLRLANRYLISGAERRHYRADLAFYSQFVRPGSLCFDIGANYGAKTEVFLALGARVVSCEPQPDCMGELRDRVGNNSRLTTIEAAVGSSRGRQTLFVERHRTASSLREKWQGSIEGAIEVDVVTINSLIETYGVPHYCKIDVEGYEQEILRGLTHRIPVVSFEYHLRGEGIREALECLDHLARLGPIEVNIAPAETPILGLSTWSTSDEFIQFFTTDIPRMNGFDYGDIFVRSKT